MCRHCGFVLEEALIYDTMSEIPTSTRDMGAVLGAQAERRKAGVESACTAIGVMITKDSFDELRSIINIRKQTPERPHRPTYTDQERIAGLAEFLPESARVGLTALAEGVVEIAGDGSKPALYGNARYEPLRAFYANLDATQRGLGAVLVLATDNGRVSEDKRRLYVDRTMATLDALLGVIRGDACLRTCKRLFVLNSRFIRTPIITPNIPLHRWIKNVFKGHRETLMKSVAALNTSVTTAFENYTTTFNPETDVEASNLLQDTLNAIATRIGGLLRYWHAHIRVNQMFVVQEQINEYTAVLRWCVYSILYAELVKLSTPEELVVKRFVAEWVLKSIASDNEVYSAYNKSSEEIKATMNDRREREKAHKINKQDIEKNPEIRKLMRTALTLGYGEDAILRKSGYNADAEEMRFQEFEILGIAGRGNHEARGTLDNPDEGMGDVVDEDGE
jgi:hypothetical protein